MACSDSKGVASGSRSTRDEKAPGLTISKRARSGTCDVAMPSATQNELTGKDARTLVKNVFLRWVRAPTCRARRRPSASSRRRMYCSPRARPRMQGELPPPLSRCSRTPHVTAGRSNRRGASCNHHAGHSPRCAETAEETPGDYVLGANIAGSSGWPRQWMPSA